MDRIGTRSNEIVGMFLNFLEEKELRVNLVDLGAIAWTILNIAGKTGVMTEEMAHDMVLHVFREVKEDQEKERKVAN